ncbi:MAG TPA: hypothetical protein VK602_11535, partial [Phyllobacterium sp.]|nr:hypothetical protein [Phyllobacterium sp.]
LGALTTEEHFVIQHAESAKEARILLDDFRAQRAAVNDLMKRLRDLAADTYGIGEPLRRMLLDAASMIESKENHIAMLRGQVAGLTHRAEAAEGKIAR